MRQQEVSKAFKQACLSLGAAEKIVVLTGAGVSKESGIPTFRENLTGIWENFSPEKLATVEGFLNNPSLVWQWYESRRQMICAVKPNAGHYALAELETYVPELVVVTQNIDGLHKLAGSKNIIELHGNIGRIKCLDNEHEALDVPLGLKEPPLCHCGSRLRPAVVWFGEPLPEKELTAAFRRAEACDVVLVVGTSGLVHPAASIPFLAKRRGAMLIEINPESTPISDFADIRLRGASAKILPELLSVLKPLKID
jgi:NAD-dependent deacetylase